MVSLNPFSYCNVDPVSFWLGQVGLLLSSLSYSLGAGGSSRSDSNTVTHNRCDDEGLIIKEPKCFKTLLEDKQRKDIHHIWIDDAG